MQATPLLGRIQRLREFRAGHHIKQCAIVEFVPDDGESDEHAPRNSRPTTLVVVEDVRALGSD